MSFSLVAVNKKISIFYLPDEGK